MVDAVVGAAALRIAEGLVSGLDALEDLRLRGIVARLVRMVLKRQALRRPLSLRPAHTHFISFHGKETDLICGLDLLIGSPPAHIAEAQKLIIILHSRERFPLLVFLIVLLLHFGVFLLLGLGLHAR